MVESKYQLQVRGSSGTSAEIIEIRNGVHTVRARATIRANETTTLLELHPVNMPTRKKVSLFKRILPRKLKVDAAVETPIYSPIKASVSLSATWEPSGEK